MTEETFYPHGHTHPEPRGLASLRERGRRLTRQRELIWSALTAEPDAHLDAEEIATRVRAQLPSVNASTIYRSLDVLVEEGLVLRTELGAGRGFYEPAHDHPHHHVVCRGCGAVVHLHDDLVAELRPGLAASSGYRISDDEVTFFGTCPACTR